MTSASRVQFSFLLPNMKPRLVSDASGILSRVTELVSRIFRGLPRMRRVSPLPDESERRSGEHLPPL
jgi:hypothetical protein